MRDAAATADGDDAPEEPPHGPPVDNRKTEQTALKPKKGKRSKGTEGSDTVMGDAAIAVGLTQLEEALQPLKFTSTTREKVTAKARTSAEEEKKDPDAAAERAGRCYDACKTVKELKEIAPEASKTSAFTEVAECVTVCASAAELPPPTKDELLKVIKWKGMRSRWKLEGLCKLMFPAGSEMRDPAAPLPTSTDPTATEADGVAAGTGPAVGTGHSGTRCGGPLCPC